MIKLRYMKVSKIDFKKMPYEFIGQQLKYANFQKLYEF